MGDKDDCTIHYSLSIVRDQDPQRQPIKGEVKSANLTGPPVGISAWVDKKGTNLGGFLLRRSIGGGPRDGQTHIRTYIAPTSPPRPHHIATGGPPGPAEPDEPNEPNEPTEPN